MRCESLLLGGDQERAQRASTQNVAGIVGLGEAAELCSMELTEDLNTQTSMRDVIIESVLAKVPGAVLNGPKEDRLPNNAHFSFEGIDGEQLITALDLIGIACSMGSACTSGQLEPSHVLKAIGLKNLKNRKMLLNILLNI